MSRTARQLVVLAAALTALCGPATLQAQSSTQFVVSFGGSPPTTVVQMPARVAGGVVIRFHGDPATGCASRGLCGYTGTIVWTPSASGFLAVLRTGEHGRRHDDVSLSLDVLNGTPGNRSGGTDADVVRTQSGIGQPGGSCADTTSPTSSVQLPVRRGSVRFSLAQASPSPLQTRCAGPLMADVASALAAPTRTLGSVRRGRMTLDLTGVHTFASHGLAGSVDSTLTIRLGRPERSQSSRSPSGPPLQRDREVQVQYRADIAGTLSAAARGEADQGLCGPLDACGLQGTFSLIPPAGPGTGQLEALGPASRPNRDFLTALGLSTAGRAGGITVLGDVSWNHRGLVRADLTQGPSACHDSVGVAGGMVALTAVHRRLLASYATSGGSPAGDLRTRCPGPFAPPEIVIGHAPLSTLSRRTVRLSFDGAQRFRDDGYSATTTSHLTLTLTRRRLRTSVLRLPKGTL